MQQGKTLFEAIKFVIVGGIATLADLLVFDLLILVFAPFPLVIKSISYIISVLMKYTGNRYWTFKSHQNSIKKELLPFIGITLVALAIDLGTFHYATNVMGPQFGLSANLWRQCSVILAALSSAVVSFLGYKFLVFKNLEQKNSPPINEEGRV